VAKDAAVIEAYLGDEGEPAVGPTRKAA